MDTIWSLYRVGSFDAAWGTALTASPLSGPIRRWGQFSEHRTVPLGVAAVVTPHRVHFALHKCMMHLVEEPRWLDRPRSGP